MDKDGMDKTSRVPPLKGKANSWYLMKPEDEGLYWIGRAIMVDYEQFGGQQIRGVRIQHWETTNKMKQPSHHFARGTPNSRCSTTYILTYLTLLCCLLCLCHT